MDLNMVMIGMMILSNVELATVFGFELRVIGLIIHILFKKKQRTIQQYKKYVFLPQEEVKCVVVAPETA